MYENKLCSLFPVSSQGNGRITSATSCAYTPNFSTSNSKNSGLSDTNMAAAPPPQTYSQGLCMEFKLSSVVITKAFCPLRAKPDDNQPIAILNAAVPE